MKRYIGLDVHRTMIEACFIDEGGRVLQRVTLASTRDALEQFVRTQLMASDQVALEATTNTWSIADQLRPHVANLVVGNPLQTKLIASARIKTQRRAQRGHRRHGPRPAFLASEVVADKSNEIPAVRALCARLALDGRLVSIDALHTQTETARQIALVHGGDYVMTVKGNQPAVQSTRRVRAHHPQTIHASGEDGMSQGPNSLSGLDGTISTSGTKRGSPITIR